MRRLRQVINVYRLKGAINVVEPLLDGMVLGLIFITLAGLFFLPTSSTAASSWVFKADTHFNPSQKSKYLLF